MFSTDHYIDSIKGNLEKHTDLVTHNLEKVVSHTISPAVDVLDFTLSIEPTRFEISIMLFSMDSQANEVFGDEASSSVFAGSTEILSEVAYYELEDEQREDFWHFYEENEQELAAEERQAFTDWFYACWQRAGGDQMQKPSYVAFHDDDQSFHLNTGQWVEDEDKWS